MSRVAILTGVWGRRPQRVKGEPCLLDTVLSLGYLARIMKIRNSLRAAKTRDKNCRVVRRHGRVYIINKKNPRMKCRQG